MYEERIFLPTAIVDGKGNKYNPEMTFHHDEAVSFIIVWNPLFASLEDYQLAPDKLLPRNNLSAVRRLSTRKCFIHYWSSLITVHCTLNVKTLIKYYEMFRNFWQCSVQCSISHSSILSGIILYADCITLHRLSAVHHPEYWYNVHTKTMIALMWIVSERL